MAFYHFSRMFGELLLTLIIQHKHFTDHPVAWNFDAIWRRLIAANDHAKFNNTK